MLRIRRITTVRGLVTSAQKRALNKEQVSGGNKAEAVSKPPPPPPSDSPSSSSSSSFPIAAVLAFSAIGAGAYYYNEQQQLQKTSSIVNEEHVKSEVEEEEKPVLVAKEQEQEQVEGEVQATGVETQDLVEDKGSAPGVSVKDMLTIGFGGSLDNPIRLEANKSPATVFQKLDGARVSVDSMNAATSEGDVTVESSDSIGTTVEVTDEENVIAKKQMSAVEAAAELFTRDVEKSAIELAQLRAQSLRLDPSISELHDLSGIDKLSVGELRLRIMQLAAAIADSARHEAMRLKEYSAMAEKQTADKYLEILQKQRVEFETLLATQLRDKEDEITRSFLEKERNTKGEYESILNTQLASQQEDFEKKWNVMSEDLQKSLNDKCEVSLADAIAENKAKMVTELARKVNEIEGLTKQLEELRQKARLSATFKQGSQSAHRVSAAALTLASKLTTSEPVFGEFANLEAIVGGIESGPISAALEKIPCSAKGGVPTLPELQHRFEPIKQLCRQAAMVPEGSGLGGQILGYAFSSILIAPPSSRVDGNPDELSLARAHSFVQQGDLESAVKELDNLKGQAFFVAKDWKEAAATRAILDQVVRILKVECALMNENMSGSSD